MKLKLIFPICKMEIVKQVGLWRPNKMMYVNYPAKNLECTWWLMVDALLLVLFPWFQAPYPFSITSDPEMVSIKPKTFQQAFSAYSPLRFFSLDLAFCSWRDCSCHVDPTCFFLILLDVKREVMRIPPEKDKLNQNKLLCGLSEHEWSKL